MAQVSMNRCGICGKDCRGKYCGFTCRNRAIQRQYPDIAKHLHKTGCDHTQFKHGAASVLQGRSPEYRAWESMKSRCLNPEHPFYHRYGGRGITIHPAWVDDFPAFYAYVGPRPAGTTLDREDNDGGYVPGNVRWVNQKTQSRNKENRKEYQAFGLSLSMPEWAEKTGLGISSLKSYAHTEKVGRRRNPSIPFEAYLISRGIDVSGS